MSNVQMRKILLKDAEASSDKSLYVMNRTDVPGAINLTATAANGHRVPVVIPNTFIPVDMSNWVPKENLIQDPTFRRLVQSGAVFLINTEDAERAIASNPRAEKEQQRIYAINAQLAGDGDKAGTVEITGSREKQAKKVVTENDNVGPFALGIVQRSKEGNEDVSDIISDIEARAYSLKPNDLDYIANNVSSSEIKQFVQELKDASEE